MDEDLAGMAREQPDRGGAKLRRGIRAHRDSTGHELCWHHPGLWGLLPEKEIRFDGARLARIPSRVREVSPVVGRAGTSAPRSSQPYDSEKIP